MKPVKQFFLYNKKEQGYGKQNRDNPHEFVAIVWDPKHATLYTEAEAEFLISLHGKNWVKKNKDKVTKPKLAKEDADLNMSFLVDTDEQQFLTLMNKLGVPVDKWTDKNCIYSTALELGAVVEYTVKRTNFSFDALGRFVGSSDEGVKSFTRPHSKVNE